MRLTFHWAGWACGTVRRNYYVNLVWRNAYAGTDSVLARHWCQVSLGIFGVHVWKGWAPVVLK